MFDTPLSPAISLSPNQNNKFETLGERYYKTIENSNRYTLIETEKNRFMFGCLYRTHVILCTTRFYPNYMKLMYYSIS